jgi:hypothetical protein
VTTDPPDVTVLLEALIAALREALPNNLLGVYFRGSLAIGDFDPETSDVDVLVITNRPVSESEFEALRQMHHRLRALPNRYAAGLEAAYIDAASAKHFVTGRKHPTITSHDPFRWERLESNWVLDIWMARERSPVIHGPDPKSVFGRISEEQLREAAANRLREWAKWAASVPKKDHAWFAERAHQAYVIETTCRALHTAASGTVSTKPAAVAWALDSLPGQWHPLVSWSQQHRMDDEMDEMILPEVRRFIHWAERSV